MILLPDKTEGQRVGTAPAHLIRADSTVAIQQEAEDKGTGRYDWGPSVMRDGDLYKMWWVRLGGSNQKRFPYKSILPDGEPFEFTYPDWGDRIYYAESRDGLQWHLSGSDFTGSPDAFGPDADGPLMVLTPAESEQERNHVGCPSVIKVDGTYYMYYEASCEYRVKRNSSGKVIVLGEYHAQTFVATSIDGKRWHKYPDDRHPQPIIRAPEANKQPGRQRYGLGQPSVYYHKGKFVCHYVDSCTGPGDCIVRVEAGDPYFVRPRTFRRMLQPNAGAPKLPAGTVARFSQTDVKFLGDTLNLLRPAFGTGNIGILANRTGVFSSDANARTPRNVFPQIVIRDPRGDAYRERLFPRFLTDANGEILRANDVVTIFYSSGLGFKEHAYTWDLRRSDIRLRDLAQAMK